MPGLSRILRARAFDVLCWAGMLLGLTGLAAVGLETASFGHEHLEAGAHASHHNHFYLGSHEHHDVQLDHDQDHHETPDPQDHGAPHSASTVSVLPTLFQPVVTYVFTVRLADSTPLVLAPAPPLVVRPAVLLIPPRAPPAALAEGSPT